MAVKVKTVAEGLITSIAIAGALVLLNVLSCGSRAKIDLTERGIYSLSAASKNLVGRLPEKLTIRFYQGNVPSEYANTLTYVDDLLSEYAESSGGKIDYQKITVDTSDSEKGRAQQKELAEDGVTRLLLMTFKDDRRQQIVAYFHVKFGYLDQKEIWNASAGGFSLEGIEYEFTSRIARLANGKQKVGVTVGYGEPERIQAMAAPGQDIGQGAKIGLGDLYDVVPVGWKENPAALADVDIVIVNGPTQAVEAPALAALDAHVKAGKPVLFLVRGMSWAPAGDQMQMQVNPEAELPWMGSPVDDGLGAYLEGLGVKVGRDVILDARHAAPGVVPLGRVPAETNLFFPMAKALDAGSGGVLEGFADVGTPLPYASSLELVGPATSGAFQVKELLRTSPVSWKQDGLMLVTRQWKPVFPKPGEKHGSYLTAVALQGQPEGGVPNTRFVVVGGAAFAEDQTLGIMRFVQNPVYVNGYAALHSMVDWLSQDTDLVSVRAKRVLRPLDAELESGDRLWIKYGNVAGVPLLLVMFGLGWWRVRERRRRRVSL